MLEEGLELDGKTLELQNRLRSLEAWRDQVVIWMNIDSTSADVPLLDSINKKIDEEKAKLKINN